MTSLVLPSGGMPSASASASGSAPPAPASLLKRSPSGQSLDALAARRCWARLDQGSSGFVGAGELHQYLQRFVAQQNNAAKEAQRRSMDIALGLEDEEEHKSSGPSVIAASASAAPARSASAAGMSARAAALVQQASAVTLRDLEELLQFADANGDGKLDLEELLAALQCFANPPVTMHAGRFESRITVEGLAGARPKPLPPQQVVVPAASPSPAPSATVAASSSPPPRAAASSDAALPPLFAAASLPLSPLPPASPVAPAAPAAAAASPTGESNSVRASPAAADAAVAAGALAASADEQTQPMEQDF